MHELSIALGIVKLAEEECTKANGKRIDVIEMEIGALSGVEKKFLDFAWPMAVKDTLLENAERSIDWIEGNAKCLECSTVFEVKSLYEGCPNCHSYRKDIIKGKELRLKSLIIS